MKDIQPHKKIFFFLILVVITLAILALASQIADNFPGNDYRIEIKRADK